MKYIILLKLSHSRRFDPPTWETRPKIHYNTWKTILTLRITGYLAVYYRWTYGAGWGCCRARAEYVSPSGWMQSIQPWSTIQQQWGSYYLVGRYWWNRSIPRTETTSLYTTRRLRGGGDPPSSYRRCDGDAYHSIIPNSTTDPPFWWRTCYSWPIEGYPTADTLIAATTNSSYLDGDLPLLCSYCTSRRAPPLRPCPSYTRALYTWSLYSSRKAGSRPCSVVPNRSRPGCEYSTGYQRDSGDSPAPQ